MNEVAPMIVSVFLFACVVIIWGGFIIARHKERMTMLEKGLTAQDIKALYERGPRPQNSRTPLMWGIILTAVGLAGLLGLILDSWYHVDEDVTLALMAVFGGIGLVLFHVFTAKKEQK